MAINGNEKKKAAVSTGTTGSGTAASGIGNNAALNSLKARLNAKEDGKKERGDITPFHYENAVKNNEVLQSLKKKLGVKDPEVQSVTAPGAEVDPLVSMYSQPVQHGGGQTRSFAPLPLATGEAFDKIGTDALRGKEDTLWQRDDVARQVLAAKRWDNPFKWDWDMGPVRTI